uniref:HDC13337 n=1 Tax=Drosophila melanogaster TaxID=7227 RepID=Q6IK59_DROME|nr:TPA_inf: HDC13337 [Drosophila melanogaster]
MTMTGRQHQVQLLGSSVPQLLHFTSLRKVSRAKQISGCVQFDNEPWDSSLPSRYRITEPAFRLHVSESLALQTSCDIVRGEGDIGTSTPLHSDQLRTALELRLELSDRKPSSTAERPEHRNQRDRCKKLSGSVAGQRRRRRRLERFSCGQLSVGSSRTAPSDQVVVVVVSSLFFFTAHCRARFMWHNLRFRGPLQLHLGQRIPQAMQPALPADRL